MASRLHPGALNLKIVRKDSRALACGGPANSLFQSRLPLVRSQRPYACVRLVPNPLSRTRHALDNETSCRRKHPAQFLRRLTCKLDTSPLCSSSGDRHHVPCGVHRQRPCRQLSRAYLDRERSRRMRREKSVGEGGGEVRGAAEEVAVAVAAIALLELAEDSAATDDLQVKLNKFNSHWLQVCQHTLGLDGVE